MHFRLGLLILVAAAMLGCRDKPSADPAPPPTPAAGAEIALFQIGQSEESVQNAMAAIPNFRRPDGTGFAVVRTGEAVSALEARAAGPATDRPVSMRFRFEARSLAQAELTYWADDAAARAGLYDRLRGGLAGSYARSTEQTIHGGGRAIWLHAPGHMLLVHESRSDPRAVSVRMTSPIFQ